MRSGKGHPEPKGSFGPKMFNIKNKKAHKIANRQK